MLKQQLRNFI